MQAGRSGFPYQRGPWNSRGPRRSLRVQWNFWLSVCLCLRHSWDRRERVLQARCCRLRPKRTDRLPGLPCSSPCRQAGSRPRGRPSHARSSSSVARKPSERKSEPVLRTAVQPLLRCRPGSKAPAPAGHRGCSRTADRSPHRPNRFREPLLRSF